LSSSTELIFAICGILLLIGLIYLLAFLAFARKVAALKKSIPVNPSSIQQTILKEQKPSGEKKVRQCSQCGSTLVDDYGFCPRCGGDLVDSKPNNA